MLRPRRPAAAVSVYVEQSSPRICHLCRENRVCMMIGRERGMTQAIAYYRVSTQRQGRSGLGIEVQRAAVARFAEAEGIEIVADHTEVETTGHLAFPRCRRPWPHIRNSRLRHSTA